MNNLFNNAFVFGLLGVIAIYLFISAPPPLETDRKQGELIPIRLALKILNQENQIIRELYTKEIVGYGKKQGLKFDENWHKNEINAGLLPAQFLRVTADYMQRSSLPIGLFLGSDKAINKANTLEGAQLQQFLEMKNDKQAKFSYINDIRRYSYMFPDIATVKPCISCHNDHKESPKSDWKMGDVMGATTWIYPDEFVTYEELVKMISVLHQGARFAYEKVLSELKAYQGEFKIAENWPKNGKFIPGTETFFEEIIRRTAPVTFAALEQLANPSNTLLAEN